MEEGHIINMIQDSVQTILLVSLPLLGIGLVIGLVISIIQATTQINEQTIVFVSKIVSVFAALLIFGPWMLTQLTEYFYRMMNYIMIILR